jgi:glycosyltransferase involved in cell wall biosynthesis
VLVCLVGEGPLFARVQAHVAGQGLGRHIRFVGSVGHEGLADWYRAANLTVLPSRSEGVPNVLLESIACGVPFVASNVGGIPEISDAALDRLVPPDDPAQLAEAVMDVIGRQPGGTERRGLPLNSSRFTRQLEAVLEGVVAGGGHRRMAS